MRIAIYHNLPSGGAKRALHEEVKRMAQHGHTLDVFTLSSADVEFGDLRPYARRHSVIPFRPRAMARSPFGRLNPLLRLGNLRRVRLANRQAAAEIDAGEYDSVFVHTCQIENSASVMRYLKSTRSVYFCSEPLRIVYEAQPWRPYDRGEAFHRRALNRIDPLPGLYRRELRRNDAANLRRASQVLVNSQYTRRAVGEIYGVQAEVAYLGVDAAMFRPLGLPRRRFVFSVGSLTPLKGFDFLIEALATLHQAERPPLVIASNFQNPAERDYLAGLAQARGVELELLGNVSDERLVELYNQASVTVYAPRGEPFGFVSIESQACATPVVGVREGGVPEAVVDGETGLLAERDAAQFGQAVCELLAQPALAEKLGRAGRQHVLEHWTWERSVERFEGWLAKL